MWLIREFTPEIVAQIVTRRAITDPIEEARLPKVMAYLDRCGATFEAIEGASNWYAAHWTDPAISDEPCLRLYSTEIWCQERVYAQAFQARVEAEERQ